MILYWCVVGRLNHGGGEINIFNQELLRWCSAVFPLSRLEVLLHSLTCRIDRFARICVATKTEANWISLVSRRCSTHFLNISSVNVAVAVVVVVVVVVVVEDFSCCSCRGWCSWRRGESSLVSLSPLQCLTRHLEQARKSQRISARMKLTVNRAYHLTDIVTTAATTPHSPHLHISPLHQLHLKTSKTKIFERCFRILVCSDA